MDAARGRGQGLGRTGVLQDHGQDQQGPGDHLQVGGHAVHAVGASGTHAAYTTQLPALDPCVSRIVGTSVACAIDVHSDMHSIEE